MKKLRWGIIGTGNIAHQMADALRFLKKQNEMFAVLSRTHERGMSFAKQYDINAVYTDINVFLKDIRIDVVYIATPHNLHCMDTIKCLEQKKAVLCEKPSLK